MVQLAVQEQERFTDTITSFLCSLGKRDLPFKEEFRIDGRLQFTVDHKDKFTINIKHVQGRDDDDGGCKKLDVSFTEPLLVDASFPASGTCKSSPSDCCGSSPATVSTTADSGISPAAPRRKRRKASTVSKRIINSESPTRGGCSSDISDSFSPSAPDSEMNGAHGYGEYSNELLGLYQDSSEISDLSPSRLLVTHDALPIKREHLEDFKKLPSIDEHMMKYNALNGQWNEVDSPESHTGNLASLQIDNRPSKSILGKSINCPLCGKVFRSEQIMKKHKCKQHEQPSGKIPSYHWSSSDVRPSFPGSTSTPLDLTKPSAICGSPVAFSSRSDEAECKLARLGHLFSGLSSPYGDSPYSVGDGDEKPFDKRILAQLVLDRNANSPFSSYMIGRHDNMLSGHDNVSSSHDNHLLEGMPNDGSDNESDSSSHNLVIKEEEEDLPIMNSLLRATLVNNNRDLSEAGEPGAGKNVGSNWQRLVQQTKRSTLDGCFPCTQCGKAYKSDQSLRKHKCKSLNLLPGQQHLASTSSKKSSPLPSLLGQPLDLTMAPFGLAGAFPERSDMEWPLEMEDVGDDENGSFASGGNGAGAAAEDGQNCVCGRTFSDPALYTEHLTTCHKAKLTPYRACDICGKFFFSNSGYVKHKRLHEGTYKFHCDICHKGFFDRTHMRAHMDSSHSKVRRYECHHCAKSFFWKHHLKRHLTTCDVARVKVTSGPFEEDIPQSIDPPVSPARAGPNQAFTL